MDNPFKSNKSMFGGRLGQDNRGQLILIGVLTMGFLLISMTLVMNGFLYAQNVESEGVPPEVGELPAAQQLVYTQYGTLLIHTNEHDSDPRTNYSLAAESATDILEDQEAIAQGHLLNVSVTDESPGRLLRQTHGGNFSDATGDEWNLTTDSVRRFQLAVNRSTDLRGVSSISQSELDDAFHIDVEDTDGDQWTIYIAENSDDDPLIAVDNGSSLTQRYVANGSADAFTIDVTTGSLTLSNTTDVETGLYADGYASNLDDTTQSIYIQNPKQIEGEFALTVPESADINWTVDTSDTSPFEKAVVYDANFTLMYESSSHYYSGTINVAPCTSGDTRCLDYITATGGS